MPASASANWTVTQAWSNSLATNHGFDGYDPFVVTADYDGDSWRLGIPIHFAITGAWTINSLIEEPPRHVDYLPVDPDDLSKGFDVINISAYKGFKVQLKQTSGQSIETGKTHTTNWSIGGGLDLSRDYENSTKAMGGVFKFTFDAHTQAKVEGHYDQTVKDINSFYGEDTLTWTNSTELDDQLDVTHDATDIWRYPIIGFETGDPSNPVGYYEVTIPGSSTHFSEGGTMFEWFSPLHVNENVLSYPQNPSGRAWIPSDVGSFKKPLFDDKGNPVIDSHGEPVMEAVTAVMNDQIVYAWDGNDHTQEIAFNSTSGTSHQKEFGGTISESADIGIGYSSKKTFPMPYATNTTTKTYNADLNFNNKNSWGDEFVASTKLSNSTGLTFSIPSISSWDQRAAAYDFTTAVYASTGQGKFKVAHTIIDLTTAPRDWWVKQYGRAPDPALNLPFLFSHHDPDSQHANIDWWTVKTKADDTNDLRHQMRGFFMRNNYPDPVTGNYELFSDRPPVDGEVVRLCARVHNFSLGMATGDFDADFYYYGWDTQSATAVDVQTGEQVYKTVWIGKARVASLDALSTPNATTWREVCVPWDTTGLSQVSDHQACVGSPLHCAVTRGQSCTTSADCPHVKIGYRFLVNLDEADVVKNEIHELNDAQGHEALGGNNSGRWPWTGAIMVSAQVVTGAPGATVEPNFVLAAGDLAIKTATGFMEGDTVQLTAGETYALRGHMVSETPYSGNVLVLFFDGKPREGGKLIGLEIGRGLRQGDNYAWAHWTPQTPGVHELHAYAFHRASTANRVGGTASRLVTVVQAATPTPTPTPTPLPTSTFTPLPTSTPAGGGDDGGCSLSSGGGDSEVSGSASLLLLGFVGLAVSVFTRRSAQRRRGRQ